MDEQLFFIINGNHTSFSDSLMFLLSEKTVWIPLYVSLLYVIWRNYSWRGIFMVLLMVGVGMLVTDTFNSQVLRPWIGRLRPSNPDNPIASLVHIVNDRRGGGFGMPSAHSANTWMLSFVMIYWIRNRWMAVTMTLVTIAVCYSRVYLGFHYPGDILGGFLLAIVAILLLACLHRLSQRKYPYNKVRKDLRMTWVPAVVASVTVLVFVVLSL